MSTQLDFAIATRAEVARCLRRKQPHCAASAPPSPAVQGRNDTCEGLRPCKRPLYERRGTSWRRTSSLTYPLRVCASGCCRTLAIASRRCSDCLREHEEPLPCRCWPTCVAASTVKSLTCTTHAWRKSAAKRCGRGSEGWCEQELAAGAWDSEPLVKNGLNIRVVSDVYDCFFTVSVRCRRATSAGDKRCGDRVAPLSRRDTARG